MILILSFITCSVQKPHFLANYLITPLSMRNVYPIQDSIYIIKLVNVNASIEVVGIRTYILKGPLEKRTRLDSANYLMSIAPGSDKANFLLSISGDKIKFQDTVKKFYIAFLPIDRNNRIMTPQNISVEGAYLIRYTNY